MILNAIGVERLSVRIEFKMIADVPDDYFDLNELPEIAKELKAEMEKEEPDVKIERLEIACIS